MVPPAENCHEKTLSLSNRIPAEMEEGQQKVE
jgi:hypothetical protein